MTLPRIEKWSRYLRGANKGCNIILTMLTHNVHGLESPSPLGGANDLNSLYKVVMARDIHRSKEVMANGNLTVKEK